MGLGKTDNLPMLDLTRFQTSRFINGQSRQPGAIWLKLDKIVALKMEHKAPVFRVQAVDDRFITKFSIAQYNHPTTMLKPGVDLFQ